MNGREYLYEFLPLVLSARRWCANIIHYCNIDILAFVVIWILSTISLFNLFICNFKISSISIDLLHIYCPTFFYELVYCINFKYKGAEKMETAWKCTISLANRDNMYLWNRGATTLYCLIFAQNDWYCYSPIHVFHNCFQALYNLNPMVCILKELNRFGVTQGLSVFSLCPKKKDIINSHLKITSNVWRVQLRIQGNKSKYTLIAKQVCFLMDQNFTWTKNNFIPGLTPWDYRL